MDERSCTWCQWHNKPLVDVSEVESEECNKNGRWCIDCDLLDEMEEAT